MSPSASSYQCTTCRTPGAPANPRNLAVFIDGTTNKPGPKGTNVVKLYHQVKGAESVRAGSEPEQHRHYLWGIGATEAVDSSLLDRLSTPFNIAFAWNVKENVEGAYHWLVENYRNGDRIYLFGFSRGAYQVRSLASMIHEVGLVTDRTRTNIAYDHYSSIDPYNDETRKDAIEFKKHYCWKGVRVHFVGVWDTVSSLGLIKKDVHITSSASVTNACHFRHALALDERRVRFMPEYFMEVNAHRSRIRTARPDISDVKEVWFAGCHSDVGGMSRSHHPLNIDPEDDTSRQYPVHAGNVSLLWMKQEAAAHGLVFETEVFAWDRKDIDIGTEDTMMGWWKILEVLPIRHQVSFCGTGKHGRRWFGHQENPRSVIPRQKIHSSVLSSDVYMPRAVLGDGVYIPNVPRKASGELWTTELQDETTAQLLTSLLSDQQKMFAYLEQVLFLFDYRLENGHIQTISRPQWFEAMDPQSDWDKFSLVIIWYLISPSSVSNQLQRNARNSFTTILSSRDQLDRPRIFYVLVRFSIRHKTLRRQFIAHGDVIGILKDALEQTVKGADDSTFQLVIDSLCDLIKDDDLRNLVEELCGTDAVQRRLSAVLEVKEPIHLMTSLRTIAYLAACLPDPCKNHLESKIIELAQRGSSPVGPAAVEALATWLDELKKPFTHDEDIPFTNILGYLGSALPLLDAEGDNDPSPHLDFPLVLQVGGSGALNENVMRKLLSATESDAVHERTTAILTLLKLCKNPIIWDFCSRGIVVPVFMKQLERKDASESLLAMYMLRTYIKIKQGTEEAPEFDRVAQSIDLNFKRVAPFITNMLTQGWFDGAIGQVEGFEVFRELMESDNLRQLVISSNIAAILMKKLEVGERHEVRMSLICLDILGSEISTELTPYVQTSIVSLKAKGEKDQMKGVKMLSALARTVAGEEAIKKDHLIEIVKMLLPSSGLSRLQLSGPAAALYNISKNETIRLKIKGSKEFAAVKRHVYREVA